MRVAGVACEQSRRAVSVRQAHINDVHHHQLGLACVKAPFEDLQVGNVCQCNAQRLRGQASEFLYRMRGRDAVFIRLRRCIGSTTCIHRNGGQGKFQF